MVRKRVKLILFIPGAIIGTFWIVLFLLKMFRLFYEIEIFLEMNMFELVVLAIVAVVPMSISMLMHSRDIIQKNKGFAVFLNVMAIFWLAGSALNATAIIILTIVFGWNSIAF